MAHFGIVMQIQTRDVLLTRLFWTTLATPTWICVGEMGKTDQNSHFFNFPPTQKSLQKISSLSLVRLPLKVTDQSENEPEVYLHLPNRQFHNLGLGQVNPIHLLGLNF